MHPQAITRFRENIEELAVILAAGVPSLAVTQPHEARDVADPAPGTLFP